MAKVLLVDDEAIITLQLEQRLTRIGYKVVGMSASGEDAITKARSLKPEIVLMDIVMPGTINGIDAAKVIHDELDIPVIFITSYADDKIIEEAKQVHPYGYIVKPFTEQELKAAIEIALYRKLTETHELAKKKRKKMQSPVQGEHDMDTGEEYEDFIEPESKAIMLDNFYQGILFILYTSPSKFEPLYKNFIEEGVKKGNSIFYAYFHSTIQKSFLKEIQQERIITHRIKKNELDYLLKTLEKNWDQETISDTPDCRRFLIDFSETEEFDHILAIKKYILTKKEAGFPVVGIFAVNIENLPPEQLTRLSKGITKVIISTGEETSISIAHTRYPLESVSVVPHAVVEEIVRKSLEPLVLSILDKPLSGYDIVHEIHTRHNVLVPQSRIYEILYDLESAGILEVKTSGKSKIYCPTEKGKLYIRYKLNEFKFSFEHIFGCVTNESKSISS
jgi:DNA-binding NarL/FixJ family response regulator/DNA-binding PadR family transcriptional regulator